MSFEEREYNLLSEIADLKEELKDAMDEIVELKIKVVKLQNREMNW